MFAFFAVFFHLFDAGAFAHGTGTVVQQPDSQAFCMKAVVAGG